MVAVRCNCISDSVTCWDDVTMLVNDGFGINYYTTIRIGETNKADECWNDTWQQKCIR